MSAKKRAKTETVLARESLAIAQAIPDLLKTIKSQLEKIEPLSNLTVFCFYSPDMSRLILGR